MQKSICYCPSDSVSVPMKNVKAKVKVLEFQSKYFFLHFSFIIHVLINPLQQKLTTVCLAFGDCCTSGICAISCSGCSTDTYHCYLCIYLFIALDNTPTKIFQKYNRKNPFLSVNLSVMSGSYIYFFMPAWILMVLNAIVHDQGCVMTKSQGHISKVKLMDSHHQNTYDLTV